VDECTGTYLSWPVNFLLASDCFSASPAPGACLLLSGGCCEVLLDASRAEDAERGFEGTMDAAAAPRLPLASRVSAAEESKGDGTGD